MFQFWFSQTKELESGSRIDINISDNSYIGVGQDLDRVSHIFWRYNDHLLSTSGTFFRISLNMIPLPCSNVSSPHSHLIIDQIVSQEREQMSR